MKKRDILGLMGGKVKKMDYKMNRKSTFLKEEG